jgi:uncharacterized membrane protein
MPADNVTPFRPRPKPAKPRPSGGLKSHRGKAVLAHVLTLAAFGINLAGALGLHGPMPREFVSLLGMAVAIAAVVLAYSNRSDGMPWATTHHEHALRTLIIGYSIWVLASLLTYISGFLGLVTLLAQLAVALWACLRAAIALVLAIMRKPVPNPRGMLL